MVTASQLQVLSPLPLTFTENGEELHFVGDDNFRAIARYNISDVYAMAVYYLSEEFKK